MRFYPFFIIAAFLQWFACAETLSKVLVQLKPFSSLKSFLRAYPQLTPSISHNFSISNFQGFSGEFSIAQMREIIHDARVAIVSKDDSVQASELQMRAPRHLSHLVKRNDVAPRIWPQIDESVYPYVLDGQQNVDVYVVDSGVAVNHPEFEGRARIGGDFTGSGRKGDTNGHGTHVAGIVGSKTYGVAKKVNIISVKVLTGDGSGSLSDVIAGVNYAADRYRESADNKQGIVNLSFGTGFNSVLNAAVDAAASVGLIVVVAAGNANRPACTSSPASSPNVITVGAIDDETNGIASFSNWGECVDIFASGVQVMSTSNEHNGTSAMSGTSMAAPIVTGLLAMLLGQGNNCVEALEILLTFATEGAIDKVSLKTRPRSPDLIATSPIELY